MCTCAQLPVLTPAHCSYGLVRVRENAESIAFYGGEDNEQRLLARRLRAGEPRRIAAPARPSDRPPRCLPTL